MTDRLQECYLLADQIERLSAMRAAETHQSTYAKMDDFYDELAMVCLADLLYSQGYGSKRNA